MKASPDKVKSQLRKEHIMGQSLEGVFSGKALIFTGFRERLGQSAREKMNTGVQIRTRRSASKPSRQ
jgi:hypothetical protein